MSIGTFLKRMMDIMRDDAGVDGSVQTLSQIVWMLFLRVYDIKEEAWELYEDDYKSAIPEDCRWRNWAIGSSQKDQLTGEDLLKFVNERLFPSLNIDYSRNAKTCYHCSGSDGRRIKLHERRRLLTTSGESD
ncbi:type I restriction-modification system subunit M N-terminal domain-containing protein [Sporolactobacillus sp. KGMB 08714]|uniref:type I restriction-modification system subunit M N-terminal domain-containing protein n=1 Tax=Sporolactobacillus sp. KGMB 08714 TaxID=3064704 RepID=UPI002FBD6C08